MSVLPTPRLTFRLGLNLILLLYIPLAFPVWEWASIKEVIDSKNPGVGIEDLV